MKALTHDELAALLKDPAAAAARTGRFACFQMIPREERIGTWRFAGTAENLAEAFERCGGLFNRVWPREDPLGGREVLLDMLDALEVSSNGTPQEFELAADATLVVLAEGGAPHDDVATAIFELKEWGALRERPIEDEAPPTPYCSAYVLELYGVMANNNGDQMGFAFAERDLASLRQRLESLTRDELRFELTTALAAALGGSDFSLRVWTVQQGLAGAPFDVRPFMRVVAGGQRSTLDRLGDVFEDDGTFPAKRPRWSSCGTPSRARCSRWSPRCSPKTERSPSRTSLTKTPGSSVS